jgi:hypothetical protein
MEIRMDDNIHVLIYGSADYGTAAIAGIVFPEIAPAAYKAHPERGSCDDHGLHPDNEIGILF